MPAVTITRLVRWGIPAVRMPVSRWDTREILTTPIFRSLNSAKRASSESKSSFMPPGHRKEAARQRVGSKLTRSIDKLACFGLPAPLQGVGGGPARLMPFSAVSRRF
jgi:hypothetical protein